MTAGKRRGGPGREQKPLVLSGKEIPAGTVRRVEVPVARLPTQNMLSMPVTVVRGRRPGPAAWLSAAIHGDEINGVEIVRRILPRLDPDKITGTVIAVPVVNVFGFVNQSRYLPDGRDLNRSFPGSKRGSLAARLCHLFLEEVVSRCQLGIDLHTGARHRHNFPQLRADLDDPEARDYALAFGAPAIVHARMRDGSLRGVATERGVPVLVFEGGENLRLDDAVIRTGERGVLRVLAAVGIRPRGPRREKKPPFEVRRTRWVRARRTGVLHLEVEPGEVVRKGQRLATISDVFGDSRLDVAAPAPGIVLGLSRNALVHRGDGLLNLGLEG